MKVYIAVDTEGQACVVREKGPGGRWGTWQAEFIREQATREAAAAVEGARAAGATEILVHDGGFIRDHGPIGLTLHYDQLPRGVRIALGLNPMKTVVDESFDAAFLLGHHAMAGVQDGVMAHTFSYVTVKRMILNGGVIGEIGIEALQLGAFGIPVVLVSADEAGCREAREWLGGVEVAPVKRGLATHSAISLHPADACDLIRERATAALRRLDDFKPFRMEPPFELRVECHTEEQARTRAARINGEMVDDASYVIRTDDPLDLNSG